MIMPDNDDIHVLIITHVVPICHCSKIKNDDLCSLLGVTECQRKYLEVTSKGPLIGAYIPQCDKNGAFSAMQCHASTGHCWCVDLNTGKEIENTKKGPGQGQPSCKYEDIDGGDIFCFEKINIYSRNFLCVQRTNIILYYINHEAIRWTDRHAKRVID